MDMIPDARNLEKKCKGVLVLFHCAENTGYAISSLESVFLEVAKKINQKNIHFSFTSLDPESRVGKVYHDYPVIEFNPKTKRRKEINTLSGYVRKNNIELVIGFDQPAGAGYYRSVRMAGVKKIISYWGAPMSGINTGLKLSLKKMEMALRVYSPDLYIFESKAMQETAVLGRGIPKSKTTVVYLGVDADKYKPDPKMEMYAHEAFNIPKNRKIIFFSGHMEKRKGVDIIVKAAINLVDGAGLEDVHFLILGNKNGEEKKFLEMLEGSRALNHVVFGGYRNDIPSILPGCYLGVIASTGWDSFTMSSLEMAASGLPLIVSDLQGLKETIVDGETGFLFPPGDYLALSNRIVELHDDKSLRDLMSKKSRQRILSFFMKSTQVNSFYSEVLHIISAD